MLWAGAVPGAPRLQSPVVWLTLPVQGEGPCACSVHRGDLLSTSLSPLRAGSWAAGLPCVGVSSVGSSHTGAVGSGRNQDSAALTAQLWPPLATCLGAPPGGVGLSLGAGRLLTCCPRPDSGMVLGTCFSPVGPMLTPPTPRQGCVDKVSSGGVSGLTGLSLLGTLQIPLSKPFSPCFWGGHDAPPPHPGSTQTWSRPNCTAPPAGVLPAPGICSHGCRRPPRHPLCPPSFWSPRAVAASARLLPPHHPSDGECPRSVPGPLPESSGT